MVSKNPGFVHGFSKSFPPMDFPPHGFWIFGEAAGAADKNQDWTSLFSLGNFRNLSVSKNGSFLNPVMAVFGSIGPSDPFTRLPSGSLEIRPWRPFLFFVGRSRGLPENPWGGKSMGWKILGKSRIFGNPDFTKKSRFENELAVFHKVV